MLHENIVVDSVCEYLESQAWLVESKCHEHQRGDDIVASQKGKTIRIEAKGEGSSRPNSARAGKAFTRNQVFDHVGKAYYRATTIKDKGYTAGMAFPKNINHMEAFSRIEKTVSELGIVVFWVNNDKSVETN